MDAAAPRIRNRRAFTWRRDTLLYLGRSTGFHVKRDRKSPTMWRVCSPDGRLSDIANRARAKDAAEIAAMQ